MKKEKQLLNEQTSIDSFQYITGRNICYLKKQLNRFSYRLTDKIFEKKLPVIESPENLQNYHISAC